MQSKELKTKISHAHALIRSSLFLLFLLLRCLSPCVAFCSSVLHFSLWNTGSYFREHLEKLACHDAELRTQQEQLEGSIDKLQTDLDAQGLLLGSQIERFEHNSEASFAAFRVHNSGMNNSLGELQAQQQAEGALSPDYFTSCPAFPRFLSLSSFPVLPSSFYLVFVQALLLLSIPTQ